jgi:hypothetical protein
MMMMRLLKAMWHALRGILFLTVCGCVGGGMGYIIFGVIAYLHITAIWALPIVLSVAFIGATAYYYKKIL